MKKKQFLLAVLIAVLVLTACSSAQPVALTDKDDGTVVEINKGDKVKVVLASNPTTGYSWQVSEINNDVLKQTGEPVYEPDSEEPNTVGGGGKTTFAFETVKAGETKLQLIYLRPWESKQPDKTFTIEIKVR